MAYDSTKDPLNAHAATAISTCRAGAAVTPDDDNDLATYAKMLFVQTGGTITFLPVENADGATLTLTVADKTTLDQWQVRRVLDTGTTASGIFAGWN